MGEAENLSFLLFFVVDFYGDLILKFEIVIGIEIEIFTLSLLY